MTESEEEYNRKVERLFDPISLDKHPLAELGIVLDDVAAYEHLVERERERERLRNPNKN